MRNEIEMMREFHRAFGHPVDQPEILFNRDTALDFIHLRQTLHAEECDELRTELWSCFGEGKISPNLLKEGADLLYVLLGTFVSLGLEEQLVEAFRRVHISNMSKLDENNKPIYRDDGKVMKGPNYKPPNLDDLIGTMPN